MRIGLFLVVLMVLALTLVIGGPARLYAADANPPQSPAQRAENHSRLGVEFYQRGLHKEAVREMMLAYKAVPDAMLLYNVARIYQKMDQGDLAMGFFKRFLAHEGADPDTVADALGHMETLESSADEPPSGAASVGSIEDVAASPEPAPPSEPSRKGPSSQVVAIPVALAGAAFGTMAIAGVAALSRGQTSKDVTHPWAERSLARAQAEDLALVSDVSLGVGLAGTIASVIALLVARRNSPAAKADVLLVPLGPSVGPGLTLSGRIGGARGPR